MVWKCDCGCACGICDGCDCECHDLDVLEKCALVALLLFKNCGSEEELKSKTRNELFKIIVRSGSCSSILKEGRKWAKQAFEMVETMDLKKVENMKKEKKIPKQIKKTAPKKRQTKTLPPKKRQTKNCEDS